jgi:peptidoglycan hydrolase FlgJ
MMTMAPINTTLSPDTSIAIMQAAEGSAKKPIVPSHIDQAAQSFEAMFVTQMIKPMFETVEVDEQFGGGKGEEIFRDFLTDEYGRLVAKSGGVGLAAPVKDALLRAQSEQTHSVPATTVAKTVKE